MTTVRVQNWNDPGKPVMETVSTGLPAGNVEVTGNLTVDGTTTMVGAATAPSVTATGAIQGATVRGTTSVRAQALQVDGSATFNNDVGIVNGAVVQNGLTVQSGNIGVTAGSITASGTVTADTINGTAKVTATAFRVGSGAAAVRQAPIADGADPTVNAILAALRVFGMIDP